MVLEGYLSRLLVDRFGRYVKGLDAENLRLSAWKGEILLKNLRLVPEALSEGLDLPVDVKWGHVGLFHLSVPWSKLGSKPVCVTLEDVYILVTPLDTWSMDDMERQRRARYQKFRRVESRLRKHLERKASLAVEGLSKSDGGGTAGKGMWARLLAKTLDNLQITVKNIHVRYEDILSLDDGGVGVDGGTSIPRPLSAGVTLRKLVAQTVDENWTPTYVQEASTKDRGGGFVYKLVTVDSLAVYCDGPSPPPASTSPHLPLSGNPEEGTNTDARLAAARHSFLAGALSDEELEGMFKISLTAGEDRHSYVVIPASPSLRLRVQRGGGGGMRCKSEAFFNDVGVVLNNSQIANINKMRSTLRDLERWEALYRHRPKHGIKDGPKAWWLFLVKSVSRSGRAKKRNKLGWLEVARLLALRKAYVRLYIARARHQATPEDYKAFTRLDEQLTANEIVAFRLKAMAELGEGEGLASPATIPVPQQQQQARQTWTEWLLRRGRSSASAPTEPDGAGGSGVDADKSAAATAGISPAEDAAAKAEFLRAFAPKAEGGNLWSEGDGGDGRILWDMEASLNEGALTLVNAGQPCLRIICDLRAELQKKKTGWKLELGLGSLQAFGLGEKRARATTLLTRRTWRSHEVAILGGNMIKIGDFQVWKSGGVVIEHKSGDANQGRQNPAHETETSQTPAVPSRPGSPRQGAGGGVAIDDGASSGGGRRGSVVVIKVVLAPHQVLHDRACVEQVTRMLSTRDMRLLTSVAQSKISRLQRATRSSFLHALGSSQRFEVTADIHAPLLILPENPKEHARSSLLVLDLGHIAFRRDDSMGGGNANAFRPSAPAAVAPFAVPEGVPTQRMFLGDPLREAGGGSTSLIAEDNWRLDISGVQAVIADSSSFFGELSAPHGASLAPAPPDTAIVEGFDVNVKIRTTTDSSTGGLVGLGLEASLPRLSFNLRSSAYLLLTRLLKKELLASATAAETVAAPSRKTSAPCATDDTRAVDPADATARESDGVGAAREDDRRSLYSDERAAGLEERSLLLPRRDRGISTVLTLDLDPVTEIPGEGPGEVDVGGPLPGGAGGNGARAPRRSSGTGGRRSSKGRSSSGSSGLIAVLLEGMTPGTDGAVEAGSTAEGEVLQGKGSGREEEEDGEDHDDDYNGLAVDVRVSAPVILVLLVHDEVVSASSSSSSSSNPGDDEDGVILWSQTPPVPPPEAIPEGAVPPVDNETVGRSEVEGSVLRRAGTEEERGGGVDGGGRSRSDKSGIGDTMGVAREEGEGGVDGALVLIEIYGLQVKYRDVVGATTAGGEEGIAQGPTEDADDLFSRGDAGDAAAAVAVEGHNPELCISAASFQVKDMHQRAGDAFSCLLSSSAPPLLSTPPSALKDGLGRSSLDGRVSQMSDAAVRITCALPKQVHPSDGGGGGGGGAKTSGFRASVALGGLWANWNPETVAALSIFAVGVYGRKDVDDDAVGEKRVDRISSGSGRVGSPSKGFGALGQKEQSAATGVDDDRAGSESGISSPKSARTSGNSVGTPGGVIVVSIRQVSLWLNKEIHGRRLLLAEVGASTVEISKVHHPEGSVTTYSVRLSEAMLTDLGTKESLWRTLAAPRSDHRDLPPQEIRLSLAQDSRAVEFPLELKLELQSCAVSYLNQTWLEAFDYVMNGVLGDGPWCPWRLLPKKTKDGTDVVAHTTAAALEPPVVVKRRMRVVVIDPVVKLPAGHAGEGWVTLDVKRLTASNRYESRRMGDDSLRNEPQLCQVWSVKLDGVDIRSCDRPKPRTNDVSSTAVPARAGSSLLRGDNEALPEGAEIEAWWPVEQEEGGPETDGLRSNYVVVGRAPDLGLNLHEHDFSILWQVLGKNITAPEPDVADAASLIGKASRGGATIEGAWPAASRRQLVTFPYEHKPLVAATFDVTFHLPAVDLVAFRDGPFNGASSSVDGRGRNNSAVTMLAGRRSQEIGRVRSRLLTWRMHRFSDCVSTNEVTAIDLVVTESLPWGYGDRELFGPATEIPPSSHTKPLRLTTPSDTDVATGPDAASPSSLPPDVDNSAPHVAEGRGKHQGRPSVVPAPTTFRWKRQGWPDGGRTDSLALSGAAVLLSRRGWGEWRLWSAVTNAREVGEDSGFPKGQPLHGSLAEKPGNECFPVVGDGDAEVAPKLAFAIDVCLSGVCVSLEPWEYRQRGDLRRSEMSGWKEGGVGGVPHQEDSAVVVRTDLAMRMTTAFFLEGYWARHLVAADAALPTEHGEGVVSLPTAADMRQGHEGPRDTTLMHLKIGKIEAFSRPAGPRSPLSSTNSPRMRTSNMKKDAGWTDGGPRRSTAAAGFPSFDDGDHHPGRIHSSTSWRTLVEPSGGSVVYSSFAPPSEESGSQVNDRLRELKQDEEQRGFEAQRRGFRRLWIEDWSPVRAVVRPSDVEVVARALAMPGDVHGGGSEEEEVRRDPNARGSNAGKAPPCSSRGEERCSSSGEDVSVRASGAGMTVRLEDDSGRHFVSPPSSGASGALSGSVREEGFVAPAPTRNERGRFPEESSQTTLRPPSFAGREVPHRPQQVVGSPTCPLGVPVTLSSPAVDGENQGASGVLDPNPRASRQPPRRRFPLQPVVEAIVGEWAFRYSRDEGGGKEGTVIETAILSASAVRVVDLLQRQSCHAAFRELLAITPSRGSQPSAQRQRQGDQQRQGGIGQDHATSLPPAEENPDRARGWLGENCSSDALGGCVRGPAPPALPPPDSFPDQNGVPNVVLNFRKITSVPKVAQESLPPTVGGHVTQAPAESSRDQCDSPPPPSLSRGSNSDKDCARGSAASASSVSGGYNGSPPMIATSAEATAAEGAGEIDSRVTVSVEVGDPIKVNWNPRTMVALWSFRKALVAAANGNAAAVVESGGALSEESVGLSRGDSMGGGAVEEKVAVGARCSLSCSTDIRVGARQGIEVMANKEKEGRRLMAFRAASLDLSVQSSHAGGTSEQAGAAVVWEGRLDGLTASDPRGSNALYSTLVGPRSPASSPAGRSGAEELPPSSPPASPVVLTFRFAKETWEGIVADVPGGPSGSALSREGSRELMEKSTLALRFSEMEVVYFQPLWLEVVDYLWEGVLGAAVWGGGAVEEMPKRVIPGDDDISTSANQREANEEGDRRRKRASEIHVTLSLPSFVLPGSLADPRHLALQPRSLEFSSWTGGPDDGESPPSVENCSPGGPVARHMVVDVPGTEISLGCYDQIGTFSRDVSDGSDPADEEFSQAPEGFPIAGGGSDTTGGERGAGSEGGMQRSGTAAQWSPILREPVDVKVSVTSMSPAAEADDDSLVERAASASRRSSAGGNGSDFSSLGVPRESGSGHDVAEGNDAVDAVETSVRRAGAGDEERMMKIRVGLTELSLALTPGSRATLIESVAKNILAAGFHGETSENFPWAGTSGLSVGVGKASASASPSAWQRSSPLSSPRESAFGSRGCASCGVTFDELVSRHQCAWCRGLVCRLCMQTPVRKSSAADVGHVERKNGVSIDAKGKGELSALICDTCAARTFPETSVDAAGKLRFNFGDDGPVMAVEVAVDVPKIRVDLQPPEMEFPTGKEGKAGADRRGGMSVEADGFELTYKRTTHRRGGLEASLRAVTVSDPCPGTVFPRILSPAPWPDSGDTPPPQLALSYYFSPTSEAAVQMMVNHLEAIIVPSAIRKLRSLAEGEPRSPQQRGKGANTSGPQQRAQSGSGAVLDGMHDLATLQLATSGDGRSEGTPKIPLTCRVTLLNPVAMLPQDETDGDCSALFLQGLVMAHYVRSPRYENASFQTNSRGHGGDGGERVSAEARDIALEIIRLESQLGRMYGGSGRSRDSGGASCASPGGLGQETGALEPLTLSLHYSEMEKQLHPMRKNLKCQVDDIKGQITYQDMALFQKILSGCWAGLSAAAFDTEGSDGYSSGGTDPKRQREARADAHPKQTRGALEARGYASTDEVSSGSGEDEEGQSGQHKQNENRRVYRVVFETRQLGLVLVKQDAVPVVEDVKAYHGVGGRSAGPFPGDELVAVAGELTSGLSYEEAIERIISSPRPIALEFRRNFFERWWGREYALNVSSWDGNSLDGIFLAGGGAGDQAVVGSTAAFRPKRRAGIPPTAPRLRPRRGALVVSVNSIPVSHLKLSVVKKILDRVSAEASTRLPSPSTPTPSSEDSVAVGKGGRGNRFPTSKTWSSFTGKSTIPGGSSARAETRGFSGQRQQQQQQQQQQQPPASLRAGRSYGRKIRVVFREVEVHAWPPNWRHEIQCNRVRVTVIDDREGRDMPLLRAEAGSLDMTHESGPGMARGGAKSRSPLVHRSRGRMRGRASRDSLDEDLSSAGDDFAAPISRTTASCEAQVDYYHATGGRWEPLVERVVAQGDREIVTVTLRAENVDGGRSELSPGNHDEDATKSVVRLSCFEEDVKINVTHAALDVILRALRDWRDYRNVTMNTGSGERQGDLDGGGAAQRYSPFVLQNRTGLPLEFWAHQDKVDSVSRFAGRGTVVGGTADMPFGKSVEARRSRRHVSWMLSLRLLPDDGSYTGGSGQCFLNLSLKETGRSMLQCMLAMEGVGIDQRDRPQGGTRQLRSCDAVWEVALENGRHKITLRSALQIVNECGSWLEVRCSTDLLASVRDKSSSREQVVGKVAPGGRLPLPLRWSRVEDIRLRPLPHGVGENASQMNAKNVPDVPSPELGGDESATPLNQYGYSDCSLLVPAARAGEKELGLMMSVIPWVACHPGEGRGRDPTTADTTLKPLFLFLEGVDGNVRNNATILDPGGAVSSSGSGSDSLSARFRRSSARLGGRPKSIAIQSPILTQPTNADINRNSLDTLLSASARAGLSLRPLEVVVYASLSFRNLLPVGVGWRVVGARGDPGARVAEGWLGPGEGANVLEANTMAMKPSFSFKMAGFDWTSPRQVSVQEISRGGQGYSSTGNNGDAGKEEGEEEETWQRPGIGLENIPCRDLANQTLYLSAEATSPRMNSVHVTIFAGFWVRNLSGLPLTLGEPIPTRVSSYELQEERERAEHAPWRHSPSPSPRRSAWDVILSAVQSDQHGATEEVFELRLAGRGDRAGDAYTVRWCTAQGTPRSPYLQVRLPSDLWEWEGDWTIDRSGAVAPDASGMDGGGWESCDRSQAGGQYGSGNFSPSRGFKPSHPVWRRRWVRRRVPLSSMRPATGGSNAASRSEPVAESASGSFAVSNASRASREGFLREGTSVIYQPASSIRNKGFPPPEGAQGGGIGTVDRRVNGAALCIRVDDSAWSRPLNISVQGAGGPFHVPGGRWPRLRRPSNPSQRQQHQQERRFDPGSKGGAGNVWGEGVVGMYELAYDVRIAPVPWNRTRVITVTSRYTVMNRCDCVLVVKQHGSDVMMELEPGESRPLHWADGRLEATLSVSMVPRTDDGSGGRPMGWSGPVGLGNIGTFPICIRPNPGVSALPADSPPQSPLPSPSTSRVSSPSRTRPSSLPRLSSILPREGEPMPIVGANRILAVEVNIGRHSNGVANDGGAGQGFRSSAVQVVFQEESWGTGDRFPTYRLENHTSFRMFYGQTAVPGPGDALPPGRSCLFGWDQPCPAEERAQGILNLSLVLAPEPLSSSEGKRLAKTLNIRRLGEKVSLSTPRGRVEVVVEPDGPTKLVRMYAPKSKLVSILSPLSPSRARSTIYALRSASQRSSWKASESFNDTFSGSKRGLERSSTIGATVLGGGALPIATPSPGVSRSSTTEFAGAGDATEWSPVSEAGGGDSADRVSVRELHVFCRAVRVSIVDGDRGEMILGSLERTSMSVAATEREVDVKLNLGSLQIDSHMPGTSFPVMLQPVRPGGQERCIRFALVAAPHVKNVTYIKLASLKVEEFDLRLDEGMVRWAQGLADRVLWTLVAERRADEMATWPLPGEAFCSPQALSSPGSRGGSTDSETKMSSRGGYPSPASNHSTPFASRYVYLDVLQVSSVKVRLSLQRAKDSFETVYVGVKPGQMLLDLMMRMDSAHIKLKSLIVHNATTTRSRLMLTAREHYGRELKQQAFLMLGSLEAFGNPVGLLRGMGQGVQDFVKEPVLGLLKSVEDLAPEELMAGMARGAGSLLKHSVGGVANSVSLITGTVSQNLSTLAMDKEYKLKRAMRKEARGDNKDLIDGIGSAGGSLARGLSDGVTGLIRNPMKGAERGGLTGFAKGVGTGMLGLVVKPVVGVTDAATDVLQGVRITTESIARIGNTSSSSAGASASPGTSALYRQHGPKHSGNGLTSLSSGGSPNVGQGAGEEGGEGLGQVRPRRVLYGPERALRPYVMEDARAAALLRGTSHRNEEYSAHLEITHQGMKGSDGLHRLRHSVVLLTRSLVLMLRIPSGELELEQRLDGIQVVEKRTTGVLLHLFPAFPRGLQQGSSGFHGLPPPPSEQGWRNIARSQTKGIPCRDEESIHRLHDMIEAAVRSAALRM